MSGTTGDLAVKIGVDGLPQFEAAFSQLEARLNTTAGKQRQYEQATLLVQRAQESGAVSAERASQALAALQTRYETQGRALNNLATANDNVAGSANRVAGQVQNASYQVGDFFVQVASGQSAITALAQQLPQLLGGFGMVGALAGAGVAIGAVVYRLMEGKTALEQHEEVLKRVDSQYNATFKAAEEWVSGLDKQAERLNILRARYQGLTEDVRQYEERQLSARRAELSADTDRLMEQGVDFSGLQGRLRSARSVSAGDVAGVSFGDLPAQVQAVTRVLDSYAVSTANAAERSLDLSNGLAAAQRTGGPLTSTLEPLVKSLDALRPKLLENSDALNLVDQMLSSLRTNSIPGAVGALADLMRQASAASTPFATLQQSISDTNSRLQALRTGGLDALKTATQQQSDALRIRKAEIDLAEAEAQRLQQTVQDDAERTRLFREGAAERTRVATEAVQAERTLATETEKAEEAKRAAEQRARAAATASRQASREALAQERAEAVALARVWDTLRRDGQSGLLVAGESDLTALRAIRDGMRGTPLDPKEVDKRANETRSLLKAQQAEAQQTTNDVVRYGADLFADMFATTKGGWDRMWQSMRRTAVGIIARIAAEAVIRPIIAPIVGSAMGSSAMAGAAGSISGSSGMFGGIGQALGLANMGETLGLGSISQSLGLSGLGGAGGLLSTPLWASGAQSAGELAFLSSAGITGSSVTTLGGLFGGAGAGFGAGMLLNSLVGGKSTGGMIGSGGGALAGAALGSIVPGVGTLIGGLLGGAGGGLLGGLFGPGAPNPAASVQYGSNGNGLMVTGSRSKHMNDAEAIGAVEASLQKINDTLGRLQLNLDASAGGQIHFGNDKDEATDQRNLTMAVLGGLRGGSANVAQVIAAEMAKGAAANLETAFSNIEWTRTVYEPLTKAAGATQTFAEALAAVAAPYDAVIAKTRDLGLSEAVLVQRRDEAVAAARQTAAESFWAATRTAEGRDYITSILGIRSNWQANGGNYDAAAGAGSANLLYDRQLRQVLGGLDKSQLLDVSTSLRGVDDAAANLAQTMADAVVATDGLAEAQARAAEEQARAAEAAAMAAQQAREQAQQTAAGAISSLANYANSLRFGTGSTLNPREQYMAAERQFNQLSRSAAGGDLASLQGLQQAAETYRNSAAGVFGTSGGGYVNAVSRIEASLGSIGQLSAEVLTASAQAAIQQTSTETLVAAIARLQEEVRGLRADAAQQGRAPSRIAA
jgi:hypothetical protein